MRRKIRIKDRWTIRFLGGTFLKMKGFKVRDRYIASKGEKLVVIANHVTDYDPMIVRYATNRFLYTLSTDNILSTRFTRFFLPRLGAIPKRKGSLDISSIKEMMYIANKGGSLLIFPEGNRSYAEFQYYIAPNFASILYKLKATIVIFNIVGGFGSYPRFSKKRRKGPLYTEVRKVIKYDEYKDMDMEVLNKLIIDNLRCFDYECGYKYKSHKKAEYLEREFFICPKCGAISSLYSKGDFLKCDKCGLEVKYNEDLSLSSNDDSFKYKRLKDWYDYQKDFVKNMGIGDDIIFKDEKVSLTIVNPYQLKKKIAKGDLVLTKDKIRVGKFSLDIKDISAVSPMSGRKLLFTIDGNNYQIKGNQRFNALKYALMFNRLDTKMNLERLDNYFRL